MADLLALLSSILVGASDFTGGLFSRRISVYAVVGAAAAVAALIFLTIGIVSGNPTISMRDAEAGVAAGVSLLIGTVLYFTALTKGRMGVVGGIVTLLVLIPIAFSVIHGETLSTKTIIGIVVTLTGAIALGIPEMRGGTAVSAIVMAVIAAVMFGISQVALDRGATQDMYSVLFVSEVVQVVIIGCIAIFA